MSDYARMQKVLNGIFNEFKDQPPNNYVEMVKEMFGVDYFEWLKDWYPNPQNYTEKIALEDEFSDWLDDPEGFDKARAEWERW